MKKALLFLVLLFGCQSNITVSVPEVTDLEPYIAKGVVVVDFGAPWCGPCRRFEPEFNNWSTKHPKTQFVRVNIDNSPKLVETYNIKTIPQVFVMKNDRMVRLTRLTEECLIEALKALE